MTTRTQKKRRPTFISGPPSAAAPERPRFVRYRRPLLRSSAFDQQIPSRAPESHSSSLARVRVSFPFEFLLPLFADPQLHRRNGKRLFVEDRSANQEIIRVAVFFLARATGFGSGILSRSAGTGCGRLLCRRKRHGGRKQQQAHTHKMQLSRAVHFAGYPS